MQFYLISDKTMIMNLPDISGKNKILLIGNIATGKTHLARKLQQRYQLPLLHVDQIQFDQRLQITPHQKTIQLIHEFQSQASWIIDGHGPLDILIESFTKADCIIFLDPPIAKIYLFLSWRWFKIFCGKNRAELPVGHNERNWFHFKKSFQTVEKIHRIMRPQIIKILAKDDLKNKVIHIV